MTLSPFLKWVSILSGALFVATLIAVPVLIALMPSDYFSRGKLRPREIHPIFRWTLLILKNILGLILIISGLAMLVLPGQGVITILVGLSLLDFPHKKNLERRLVQNPQVLKTMNWIRIRANRPPLEPPL